jgi:hypothetical protein
MSPVSVFLANYNRADTDYTGTEWVYPSHVAYTFTSINALAEEAGLRCLELDSKHPAGASWTVTCDPTYCAQLKETVSAGGLLC